MYRLLNKTIDLLCGQARTKTEGSPLRSHLGQVDPMSADTPSAHLNVGAATPVACAQRPCFLYCLLNSFRLA
jgi:hypothetical protein